MVLWNYQRFGGVNKFIQLYNIKQETKMQAMCATKSHIDLAILLCNRSRIIGWFCQKTWSKDEKRPKKPQEVLIHSLLPNVCGTT